jgi:hypothetical protein
LRAAQRKKQEKNTGGQKAARAKKRGSKVEKVAFKTPCKYRGFERCRWGGKGIVP